MVSPARDPLPPDCRARQHGGLAQSVQHKRKLDRGNAYCTATRYSPPPAPGRWRVHYPYVHYPFSGGAVGRQT